MVAIIRTHENTARYEFDFDRCSHRDGWAQLDTNNDASYYGNWINPLTFEIMAYVEGDVIHTRCDDANEFISELRANLESLVRMGYAPKIDGMCNDEVITRLDRFGFREWMH